MDRLDLSAPVSIVSPGAIVPVASGTSSRSSGWISTGVPGWRSSTRELCHVVVVVVGEQHVGERELPRSRQSSSGCTGPPASIITACPPRSSATRYVFDRKSSFIERSTITS